MRQETSPSPSTGDEHPRTEKHAITYTAAVVFELSWKKPSQHVPVLSFLQDNRSPSAAQAHSHTRHKLLRRTAFSRARVDYTTKAPTAYLFKRHLCLHHTSPLHYLAIKHCGHHPVEMMQIVSRRWSQAMLCCLRCEVGDARTRSWRYHYLRQEYVRFISARIPHRVGQWSYKTENSRDLAGRLDNKHHNHNQTTARTTMAAIFDKNDPTSPTAYSAAETALLLLDFHGFCISLCGDEGVRALETAVRLREWALQNNITVIHSLVDLAGDIPRTSKGAARLQQMISSVKDNESASSEHSTIAPKSSDAEFTVLKRPGVVSNLASEQMQALLAEKGINSLIICGLSTSGCVLRTTVPATDQGFVVTVIEVSSTLLISLTFEVYAKCENHVLTDLQDACADRTTQLHNTLMKEVLPSRAHVTTAAELMKQWSG